MLIFAADIGGGGDLTQTALMALFNTFLAFGAAVALGQYILSPLMKSITRYDDPEMFTMLGLLIVMMTALATASVGLSLTLGAFLAGMVLAETPFRVLLQSELRPFRSLLMAFFFITVGMMLNPIAIWNEIGLVASLTLLIIASKGALIAALAYLFGRQPHHVIQLGFLLSQGSEFAFVIFSMAGVEAALGLAFSQQLIAAVALSMLATPFLYIFAYRLSIKVCENMGGLCNACETSNPPDRQPVFIVGMNETGKTLARAFKAHKIPYIAVERNRQQFLEAIAAGYIVAYGQTNDMRFWNTLGVGEARAMCITSPHYETAQKIAPIVKKLWPNLVRYAAVSDSADAVRFASLGHKPFNNKGAPPGLEMACHILEDFGIDEDSIMAWSENEQAEYLKIHGKNLFIEKNEEQNNTQVA